MKKILIYNSGGGLGDSIQLIHPHTSTKASISQITYVGGDINA